MSVDLPTAEVVFGSVTPSLGRIIDLVVHLGCTKEVSSFKCLLNNWDEQYSPGGATPITFPSDATIKIGRGSNKPLLLTGKVEDPEYFGDSQHHYLEVVGRCLGEQEFRRNVTKGYISKKGEEIVKDLIDNYTSLSHNRSGELIENTSTTFNKLYYDGKQVSEILQYIAKTSDLSGVIGFDFRVAPDGKFEFFPVESKTSAVSLTDKLEFRSYRPRASGIRNRAHVYGANEAKLPSDGDLAELISNWEAITGTVSAQSGSPAPKVGSYWILGQNASPATSVRFKRKNLGYALKDGMNLRFWYREGTLNNTTQLLIRLYCPDYDNRYELANFGCAVSDFTLKDVPVGPKQTYDAISNPSGVWTATGSPNWFDLQFMEFYGYVTGIEQGLAIGIDGLHFAPTRYYSMQEDSTSIALYGLRELPPETDDELYSNAECQLRAKALRDYYKNPISSLTLETDVLDYGTTPLLAGDKIPVVLPNENVNGNYRMDSVEYHLDGLTETLTVAIELGRQKPLMADYIYALRSKTRQLGRRP